MTHNATAAIEPALPRKPCSVTQALPDRSVIATAVVVAARVRALLCVPIMSGANYYDLHGHSKRIHYYPEGRGGPIGPHHVKGPVLIYDDGSSQVQCSGDDIIVGKATVAGTAVTALVRKNGIVPGAITSLVVMIPDVSPQPADGSVSVHTTAILVQHRPTPELGPGQLETYSPFPVVGNAALVKLPL